MTRNILLAAIVALAPGLAFAADAAPADLHAGTAVKTEAVKSDATKTIIDAKTQAVKTGEAVKTDAAAKAEGTGKGIEKAKAAVHHGKGKKAGAIKAKDAVPAKTEPAKL